MILPVIFKTEPGDRKFGSISDMVGVLNQRELILQLEDVGRPSQRYLSGIQTLSTFAFTK